MTRGLVPPTRVSRPHVGRNPQDTAIVMGPLIERSRGTPYSRYFLRQFGYKPLDVLTLCMNYNLFLFMTHFCDEIILEI